MDTHLAPPTDRQSRLPLLYFTIMITIMHICNVMAFKTVTFFGLTFAFTGIFFPLSFLLLTALTESYGHIEAERHILYILIGQTLLIAVISFVVRIDVASGDTIARSYYDLYRYLPRLLISSNLAVGLSYYFTALVSSRFKCWLLGRMWWLRFLIANGIGQIILVIFTYPINFYHLFTAKEILLLCINTWAIKMCLVFFFLLLSPFLIMFNKKIDEVDIYDFKVQYNPLKLYKKGNYGQNWYQNGMKKR